MEVATIESWVKIVGGSIAAAAAIVAAFKGLAEWRRSITQRTDELQQRQREFRHKQALFARELSREVFADVKARAALKMLDWISADYDTGESERLRIERGQIQHAMRVSHDSILRCSPEDAFIRTRFEALYDYFEQIENLLKLDVINFTDIETVFRYYAVRILRKDIRHDDFLDYYDYPHAKQFLARFDAHVKRPSIDEPSHPPETAAGPVSSGKSSPPAQ